MLYFFTDPYEDEVTYGIFARYNRYSGNLSSRKTGEELFGKRIFIGSNNFPSYLEYFSSRFPRESMYSSDYFIEKHTIFPMYRPFLPQERVVKIVNDMKGENSVSIHMRIGEMAGGICKDFGIRICLDCMKEDVRKYGESYIHRVHQVPGNQVCSKHIKPLNKLVMPRFLGKGEIINFSECTIDYNNEIINQSNRNDFINFSNDISVLFNYDLNVTNLDDIIKKYKVMMMKKGFSSVGGIIKWSKLDDELLNFYSADFLDKLESNITREGNYRWTRQILNNNKIVHPIRHLLFIRFLFGSIDEFREFGELEYRPFGSGPWPCLNPASSHYKEEVVTDLELSNRSKASSPLGIFKCHCGYIYTRLGPDTDVQDRYKKRMVKSYGEIWLNLLKDNINKQIYNISELERIMECDSKTIGKYAKELGIFHLLNSRMKVETTKLHISERYNKSLEEPYKEEIKRFIRDNPNSSRKTIFQKLGKQCAWMERYRKDWLESILPEKMEKKTDKRTRKSYVDWMSRDMELSEKLNKIFEEIKLFDRKIKITMGFLCREVKFPMYKHIDKLPLTKEVLIRNSVK